MSDAIGNIIFGIADLMVARCSIVRWAHAFLVLLTDSTTFYTLEVPNCL